ncbi:helix-turn-helix domain-containing protein [bacterium]|nr:helix-turn-helix domain-containing protein [bacterium]
MKVQTKLITPKNIGNILKEKRQEKGISLEFLEKELRIGKIYLSALEQGDYEKLPSKVYAVNFLRRYLDFLGIENKEEILSRFEEESSFYFQDIHFRKKESKVKKVSFFYFYIPLVVLTVALFSFVFFKILPIFQPPFLEVYSPLDNQIVYKEPLLLVKGKTEERNAYLYINGHLIENFKGGDFEEYISLNPGLNIIEVAVKKEHSSFRKVTRKVVFVENPPEN